MSGGIIFYVAVKPSMKPNAKKICVQLPVGCARLRFVRYPVL